MRDEINEPLGQKPEGQRTDPAVAIRRTALALTALLAGAAGLWVLRPSGGDGTASQAVARIEGEPAAPVVASAATATPGASETTEVGAFASGTQIEKASGVKVTRNGGGGAPGALIIDVPKALGVRLTPAPDPRLVENSKFGPLPRIGADGSRPADVYARPIVESVKLKGAPRIAILVGGLGLDRMSTEAAIDRLPASVSLGFAPYGDQLVDLAAKAREGGHELLLQAPMEGFGGPTPGPHTLSAAASESENRDSLRWMMSRFPGFVGVSNYLGAKFTADAKTFSPVLAEIGSRGLIYLDDGSSPRSLTGTLAAGLGMRAGQADVVIDANPSPEAIEIALAKLETLARHQDGVIGVATALPVSLEHIAHWADSLEARGIALTPVSALVSRGSIRSAGANP